MFTRNHSKTCIFIDFQTIDFKESSWSRKKSLMLKIMRFETGTKKIWVGLVKTQKPKRKFFGARFEIKSKMILRFVI